MKKRWLAYVLLFVLILESVFVGPVVQQTSYAKTKTVKLTKVKKKNSTMSTVKNENTSTKSQTKKELTNGDVLPIKETKISDTEAAKLTNLVDVVIGEARTMSIIAHASYSSTYGRSKLSAEKKAIYDEIVTKCQLFDDDNLDAESYTDVNGNNRLSAFKVEIEGKIWDDTDLLPLYMTVVYDNPQYFWLDNSICWMTNGTNTTLVINCHDDYKLASVREELNRKFDTEIQGYLAMVNNASSKYEMELIIHDALASRLTYAFLDGTSMPQPAIWAHSIVGAFDGSHNSVVCEGFAKAFQLIMNACGIECILVPGKGHGEGHTWNKIKLDDNKWYCVDVTWDQNCSDSLGVCHDYLNKTDSDFTVSQHVANTPSATNIDDWCYELPICNSATYQYQPITNTTKYKLTYNTLANAAVNVYNAGLTVDSETMIASGAAITLEVEPTQKDALYNVTYSVNGGSEVPLTKPSGSQLGDFLYKTESPLIMPESDAALLIKCERSTPLYKVDFDTNGGSVVPSIDYVVSGQKITPWPSTPTKGNYAFGGWYTDTELNHPFTVDDVVSGNLTLHAKWIPKQIRGISAEYIGDNLEVGARINKTDINLLANYNDSTSEIIAQYLFTISPEVIENVGDNNITITYDLYTTTVKVKGVDRVTKKTVTFDSKSGSNVEPITDITAGDRITMPNIPTREGFYFDGWYLSDSYLQKFDPETRIDRDYTLYAKWIRLLENPSRTIKKIQATYKGNSILVGSSVSRNDIDVVVTDNNDKIHHVTDYTLSKSRIDTLGNNTLTITYGGFSANIIVKGISTTSSASVISKYVTYISAGYFGGPVEVGSYVDRNNITVAVAYSDNSVQYVRDFSVSNEYISSTGNNTLYVYYGGYSQSIIVVGVPKGSLTTTTPVTPEKSTSVVTSSTSISTSVVTGGYQGYVTPKVSVTTDLNYSIVGAEIEENALASVTNGKELSNTNVLKLSISNVSTQILTQLSKTNVSEVFLNISMPIQYLGRNDIQISNIALDSATLTRLKNSNKKLTVQFIGSAYNADTDKTTFTNPICSLVIKGTDLTQTNLCNASLRVNSLSKEYEVESAVNDYLKEEDRGKGVVVTLGQEGELKKAGKVKLDVGGSLGSVKGDKLYVYGYNAKTARLEELPITRYTVDKNQNIELAVNSYSKYVILKDETDKSVDTLASRATVSKVLIAKKGGKKQITVVMPEGININDAKLKYISENKKIATVSKNGTITTKKKGNVIITTTVTYNNKSKKFKTKLKIK